ncbi:putative pentatricopeptide repeat-containing protein [Tanacetum coccineum]
MDIPHIRLLQHSARPHPLRLNAHPTQLNQRTLAIVLKTCDFLSSLTSGLQVHALAIKVSLATEPFTASGLKDAVCFSSVIVRLDQNSKPVDALSYFAEMRASGFLSTDYCVSGALRASSELETLEQWHAWLEVIGAKEWERIWVVLKKMTGQEAIPSKWDDIVTIMTNMSEASLRNVLHIDM